MRAARVDLNHGEIRDELRQLGFEVADTHSLGNGYPDLHVSKADWSCLVEIKQPGKENNLTPKEKQFHDAWQGLVIVATTAEDVVAEYNAWHRHPYNPKESAKCT